ncbi:uncharacterized protein LOC115829483 [Chanos chanos]|uniref:Uncharacterized protein LOC115829483 n=1 Tax=Chanos chanos TaxID=29144 RepID=A0A6J2WZA4_CHACN|nr:uncharacterized protein LOC115829483 [Chanos chanos]
MNTRCKEETEVPVLPLPLLRFVVPPLRLLCAAMWQVAEKGQVKHYGMLEEFVTLATGAVPELLSYHQRAQLILGLRARLILDLCQSEHPTDLKTVQSHLDRLHTLSLGTTDNEVINEDVELSEANFIELVQTLVKDPVERDHFFQNIFPVEYGSKFDKALQRLMLDFLLRLEQLIPVPDLTQIVSLLSAAPTLLEECLQSVTIPEHARSLLQHYRDMGHLAMHDTLPSCSDDCILTTLSLPPLVRVVIASDHMDSGEQSESGTEFDGGDKEESLEFLDDHQRANDSVKKEEETQERERKVRGRTWPCEEMRLCHEEEEEEEEEEKEKLFVESSCLEQPLSSPSPPLLDLSLPRARVRNVDQRNSERKCSENPPNGGDAWPDGTGQDSSRKRKRTDCYETPLKQPLTETSSPREQSREVPFIYPWGGYTDIQEPVYHTTSDASKIPWSEEETLNLIDIWGKDCVQRSLKDCLRNRHIFNLISKKMHERGFLRTAEQCHTRIKRLKMSFRQCYENNISGGERLECKFYDQLERILGKGSSSSVPELAHSIPEISVSEQSAGEREDTDSEKWELLGHSGLEGTKNVPWTDLETRTLISIWGEDKTQRELRGVHQNGHIFALISKKMATYGYIRTAEQCQTRLKRLKLSFRHCYENNNVEGQEQVEFKFYDQMEKILENDLHVHGTFPEDSSSRDVEIKNEESAESEFPVYSYQEIEAALNMTDERKKVPWSDGETLVLLQLWGDERVQENLRRCPHNGHIYSEISEQLAAHGYSRTSEQCHTRIKRLKLSYRQCRDSLSLPEAEHVEFKFYGLMEEILKKNPPTKKRVVVETESSYVLEAASSTAPEKTSSGSWSDPETLALIDIWAEDEIQKALKGVVHNGHVFADISEKMHELGFLKSPEQCRWKVKTLRKNFRQCYERKKCGRDKVGYKFYDQLEQVLGYEALSIDIFDEKDDQEDSQRAALRAVAESSRKMPWSDRETQALLDIWGEDRVQHHLKGCLKNKRIFKHISKRMTAQGFIRTAEQCQTRIKRLKARFYREREDCKFYEQLEQVILKEISTDTPPDDPSMPSELESITDSEPESPALASRHASDGPKLPWADSETQVLIDIWGNEQVQNNLRGCVKNRHIFSQISQAMAEQGYNRTAEQCQSRVKRLKASFRHSVESSRNGGEHIECKFYDQLAQIFGNGCQMKTESEELKNTTEPAVGTLVTSTVQGETTGD